MVSFHCNLTQPRIPCKESLSEGYSIQGWPVGMAMVNGLKLILMWRTSPLWVVPSLGRVLNCVRSGELELNIGKQASKRAIMMH